MDITVEILKALHYTHVKGVAHRDIKAENILVKR
jgi:serine/threonine protein kinase